MIRHLATDMLGRLLRTPWRLGLLLAFLATLVGAAASGLTWRAAIVEERAEAPASVVVDREAWFDALRRAESGEAVEPFLAQPMQLTFVADLPVGPLADFAHAHEDVFPVETTINGFRNEATLFRRHEVQGPPALAVGRLDLTFAVVVVMPLVLLLLTFDTLSREHESGRLALLVVHGASPWRLVATRVLVVAAVVWLLVAAVAATAGMLSDGPQRVGRLLLWLGVMTAYWVFWVAVCLLTAVVFRTVVTSAMGALAAWVVLVLVLPSTVQLVASALYPPPSRVDWLSEARLAEGEARRNIERRAEVYMAEHSQTELEGSGAPGYLRSALLANLAIADRTGPVFERFEAVARDQAELMAVAGVLAPPLLARTAFVDVAGAGSDRARAFQQQARGFLRDLLDAIGPATVARRRLGVAEAEALPVFEFAERAATAHRFTIPYLVLLSLLCGVFAWGRMRRQ